MCGRRNRFVAKIREKLQENVTGELTAYHCLMHQELLRGKDVKIEHVMGSSGHRMIWWGGCDVHLQLTQCLTGP